MRNWRLCFSHLSSSTQHLNVTTKYSFYVTVSLFTFVLEVQILLHFASVCIYSITCCNNFDTYSSKQTNNNNKKNDIAFEKFSEIVVDKCGVFFSTA